MVNWLVLRKRCPKGNDTECALLTTTVYYIGSMCKADAKHYMGMGLPANKNHCCLYDRNSSKPNPPIFVQAGAPPPSPGALLRRARQELTPEPEIRAQLPAHLQEWTWISFIQDLVFTADAEMLRKQEKIDRGEGNR